MNLQKLFLDLSNTFYASKWEKVKRKSAVDLRFVLFKKEVILLLRPYQHKIMKQNLNKGIIIIIMDTLKSIYLTVKFCNIPDIASTVIGDRVVNIGHGKVIPKTFYLLQNIRMSPKCQRLATKYMSRTHN